MGRGRREDHVIKSESKVTGKGVPMAGESINKAKSKNPGKSSSGWGADNDTGSDQAAGNGW